MRGYRKDNPQIPTTNSRRWYLSAAGPTAAPRRSRSVSAACPLRASVSPQQFFWMGIAYDCASKLLGGLTRGMPLIVVHVVTFRVAETPQAVRGRTEEI